MIALRKPRRVATSVDDLVRRGTLSRAMATFLRHVVVAGGNILVVGARDARASDVANALASLSDAYWITVGDDTEFLVGDSRVTRLSLSREDVGTRRVLSAAAQLGGARLLVENASAELGVGVIESVGAGASGLIASLVAGSLEQGLERLVTDCMARAGSGRDAARQQVASAFSLVIEVAQLRDHRFRVLRIAEPSGATVDGFELEDIFAFSFQRTAAGGAVEGTFAATGAVPRLAQELGSRGVPIEAGLFSRSSR
jgi:pilus assembly protein CpaF